MWARLRGSFFVCFLFFLLFFFNLEGIIGTSEASIRHEYDLPSRRNLFHSYFASIAECFVHWLKRFLKSSCYVDSHIHCEQFLEWIELLEPPDIVNFVVIHNSQGTQVKLTTAFFNLESGLSWVSICRAIFSLCKLLVKLLLALSFNSAEREFCGAAQIFTVRCGSLLTAFFTNFT